VPLLRVRSDAQLVALFRAGNDEAFRVIHDRYRQRLLAYTRQMLRGSGHDFEGALQDVFMRAYSGLRANDRELALRAWLYRVAHNRCLDDLRRPAPQPAATMELVYSQIHDPVAETEQRESLKRLLADVRRLPDQQRSALLMRELGGMAYVDVAGALGVSVAAVKSLLVRARAGLVQAGQARDTACAEIRDELIAAHDRGMRPTGLARRHLRDCEGCREFRGELRGVSHQLAALIPVLGPIGIVAKLLGLGGGTGGGVGAAGVGAAGGAAGTVGVAGTTGVATSAGVTASVGLTASVGTLATGAGHAATLLAAAVIAVGGAAEVQHATSSPAHRDRHDSRAAAMRTAPQRRSTRTPEPLANYRSATDAASGTGAGGARAVAPSAGHPGTRASSPVPVSSRAARPSTGGRAIGTGAAMAAGATGNAATNAPTGFGGAGSDGAGTGSGAGLGGGAPGGFLPADGSVTASSSSTCSVSGSSTDAPSGSSTAPPSGSSVCMPSGLNIGSLIASHPQEDGGPAPAPGVSPGTTVSAPALVSGSASPTATGKAFPPNR